MKFTIVCATNDNEVLNKNLLASPCIISNDLILKLQYSSVSKAYNDAIREANQDVIIFVHQDVYLPITFHDQLNDSIKKLGNVDWGVLGVAGVKGSQIFANVLDRGNILKSYDERPTEVRTLDELILIIKKYSFNKIKFDEKIPHHHLFGADICLQANQCGMNNYVVDAYCHHNSSLKILPDNYFDSENYMRKKWLNQLPINTTCSRIE